jgi:RHS repeat-associated protein
MGDGIYSFIYPGSSGEKVVYEDGTVKPKLESSTFEDPCQAAEFGASESIQGFSEENAKTYKLAKEACDKKTPEPVPHPAQPWPSGKADGVPSGLDTPIQQAAPWVSTTGYMAAQGVPANPQGIPPADLVHAQKSPQPPAAVLDLLGLSDVSPEEADERETRWLHNDPEVGERHPTHSGETTRLSVTSKEPVEIFSGLFVLTKLDLEVPTPILPLRLQRTYRSGRPYFGPWGFGWDHNYNVYVRDLNDGGVARWTGEMHEDYFGWTGEAFEPERGVRDRLERLSGEPQAYVLTRPGGITLLFKRPQQWTDAERIPLVEIRDRHGNSQELLYDSENRLTRVSDQAGRALNFLYGLCGLLEGLEDHTGRHVRYNHCSDIEHLAQVVSPPTAAYPEGMSTCYEYDERASHPAMQHNLLRVTDADGRTYLQNDYGGPQSGWAFNRVVHQRYGDFEYEYEYEQIQYVPEDATFVDYPAIRAAVRQPDCSLHTYTFNYRGDLLDYWFRLNRDGSYRVVASQWQYDEQGNVIKEVGPDGSQTVYTFDSQNPDPCARGNLLKVELFAPLPFVTTSRVVLEATYDPLYQLPLEMVAENHSITRFIYDFDIAPGPDATGKPVRILWPDVTLPDGSSQEATTEIEANSRGQVTALVSPEGSRHEFRYLSTGTTLAYNLFEEEADVGGLGVITQYEYDERGFLSRQVDGEGVPTEWVYDDCGEIEELLLPPIDGVTDRFRFRYGPNRELRVVESPRGSYTDSVVSGEWIREELQTDCLANPIKVVLGANTEQPRTHRFCCDFEGRPVEEVDAAGITVRRHYDERGLLLSQILAHGTPAEHETRYVYDRAGHMVEVTKPGNRKTVYEYDPWGREAMVKLPNGTLIHSEWGALDLLLSRTIEGDPGDGGPPRVLERTDFEYDSRSRLVRSTLFSFVTNVGDSLQLVTTYWHDRDNRCTKEVYPRNAVWIWEYDGLGRPTRVEDPLGNITITEYDANDRLKRVQIEQIESGQTRVRTTLIEYDARGRAVRQVSPGGHEAIARYDSRNLQTEIVAPNGIVTQNTFGLLGEIIRKVVDVQGLGLAYSYDYDLLGRSISFEDPTLEKSSLERDELGRVVKVSLADGTVWERAYSAAGDLERVTAPGASMVHFIYDQAGRVRQITSTAGPDRLAVPVHEFEYDGLDRIVSASTGGAAVQRAYDGLARLRLENVGDHTFERIYDDTAGKSLLVYPDGRVEEQEWDLLGRIERIRLAQPGTSEVGAGSGTPGDLLLEVEFAGAKRVSETRHGNGVVSRWHYDDEGRVIRVEHGNAIEVMLESSNYRHDVGNRRRVAQLLGTPTEVARYDYDGADRLRQVWRGFEYPPLAEADTQALQDADIAAAEAASAVASETVDYDLDGSDTRLSTEVTIDGVTTHTQYTSLPGHRIASVGQEMLTYDSDGNRTADAESLLIYDSLGRCAKIQDPQNQQVLAEFEYDALGRLAGGEAGGKSFRRYYFGEVWLQEEDSADMVRRQRTLHPSLMLPVAEALATGTHYLHVDGHQNLVLATDGAGSPVERYRYGTFGAPRVFNGEGTSELPASAVSLQPTFGGMPYWWGAELFGTPLRLYDPATGAFVSRDPDLYGTSPSPYVLSRHDPVNLVDPGGDFPMLIVLGVAVVAAGIVGYLDANEDPREGRSFMSRGGGTLLAGGGALGVGALLLAAATGPVGLTAAGMTIAGGLFGTGVGVAELGMSYSGQTTAEEDLELNRVSELTMSMSSPGGLIGGTTGVILEGSEQGLEQGAIIGGIAEAGLPVVYGGGKMIWNEAHFQYLRWSRGVTSWHWNAVRPLIQEVYGVGSRASRVRPNPLFWGEVERMDLSHFMPQRWGSRGIWKGGPKLPEWLLNRPANTVPMWSTEHALVDPHRFQRMTGIRRANAGLPAFKPVYRSQQIKGIEQYIKLAPPWMRQAGTGAALGANDKLRRTLIGSGTVTADDATETPGASPSTSKP